MKFNTEPFTSIKPALIPRYARVHQRYAQSISFNIETKLKQWYLCQPGTSVSLPMSKSRTMFRSLLHARRRKGKNDEQKAMSRDRPTVNYSALSTENCFKLTNGRSRVLVRWPNYPVFLNSSYAHSPLWHANERRAPSNWLPRMLTRSRSYDVCVRNLMYTKKDISLDETFHLEYLY